MKYPYLAEAEKQRDMMTNFAGLNNRLTNCGEGQFFDQFNMTTKYYPVLSPRSRRGEMFGLGEVQGVLGRESLIVVSNGSLYIDGQQKRTKTLSATPKQIYKMGAYIVIMPDKVWFNCDTEETGNIDAGKEYNTTSVSFSLCNQYGEPIVTHDEEYYKQNAPKTGDYLATTTDTKTSIKVYSELTKMWSAVTTTYISIYLPTIGHCNLKEGDGVKITTGKVDIAPFEWDEWERLFPNEEDDGKRSMNFVIKKIDENHIVVPGLLGKNTSKVMFISVYRKMPEMAYLTECQNRLWGCSTDGHEIYCSKLGDVTNWNCFEGISTDSYAATVGSDGVFTGAVTYNLNPIFFKEHSFLKVSVSQNGAHSYREQMDKGCQNGSSESICIVNGVLFYKGVTDVYAFDGSIPLGVGEALGEHRFSNAKGGTIDDRYYLAMTDEKGKHCLYSFNTKNDMWSKEDDIPVDYFCTHKDDLYIVAKKHGTSMFYSVCGNGELEKPIKWWAESGYIGFAYPDNKYVSRLNIRMSLDIGSYVDFWLKYDNDTEWHHIFNMSGKGTKSFTIPVMPRRCDHFRYKISGTGECKIFSISKTIEQGSDE